MSRLMTIPYFKSTHNSKRKYNVNVSITIETLCHKSFISSEMTSNNLSRKFMKKNKYGKGGNTVCVPTAWNSNLLKVQNQSPATKCYIWLHLKWQRYLDILQ